MRRCSARLWAAWRGKISPRPIGLVGACLLILAGCAAPGAPAGAQPPPPKFLFQQDFAGDQGQLLATVDREVYPAQYAGLWHTHPGPGSFCVLQGTLVVEVRGGADVPLHSGQCWQEQPGVIHRPVNRSDQEATALFYLLAPANGPRIIAAPTPVGGRQGPPAAKATGLQDEAP